METIISVQFKNKNKEFVGRTYDFLLCEDEEVPKTGDIVRLLDPNYELKFYGTRVKLTNVRVTSEPVKYDRVRYLKAALD